MKECTYSSLPPSLSPSSHDVIAYLLRSQLPVLGHVGHAPRTLPIRLVFNVEGEDIPLRRREGDRKFERRD